MAKSLGWRENISELKMKGWVRERLASGLCNGLGKGRIQGQKD